MQILVSGRQENLAAPKAIVEGIEACPHVPLKKMANDEKAAKEVTKALAKTHL